MKLSRWSSAIRIRCLGFSGPVEGLENWFVKIFLGECCLPNKKMSKLCKDDGTAEMFIQIEHWPLNDLIMWSRNELVGWWYATPLKCPKQSLQPMSFPPRQVLWGRLSRRLCVEWRMRQVGFLWKGGCKETEVQQKEFFNGVFLSLGFIWFYLVYILPTYIFPFHFCCYSLILVGSYLVHTVFLIVDVSNMTSVLLDFDDLEGAFHKLLLGPTPT